MPRKLNITPTTKLQVWIPAPLKARVDLHLWSELEGRVPLGAHQKFIVDLLNDFFRSHHDPRSRSNEPSGALARDGDLGRDDGRRTNQSGFMASGEAPGCGNRIEDDEGEDEVL